MGQTHSGGSPRRHARTTSYPRITQRFLPLPVPAAYYLSPRVRAKLNGHQRNPPALQPTPPCQAQDEGRGPRDGYYCNVEGPRCYCNPSTGHDFVEIRVDVLWVLSMLLSSKPYFVCEDPHRASAVVPCIHWVGAMRGCAASCVLLPEGSFTFHGGLAVCCRQPCRSSAQPILPPLAPPLSVLRSTLQPSTENGGHFIS